MGRRKKRISPRKFPVQARSRETVECILAATTRILEKEGILALSTNRVAREAGVSIGSLYQYFPSKEALLSELVRTRIFQDQAYFEKELRGFESWPLQEKLRRLISAGIEIHRRDHKILKVMFEQLGGTGQIGIVNEVHMRFYQLLVAILLAEPRLSGEPERVNYMAYVYAQTILGVWHSQVEKPWSDLQIERVVEVTTGMILRDVQD